MPRFSVRIGRFPYGGTEVVECVDWLIRTSIAIDRDKRFEMSNKRIADTPITMTRNRMFQQAIKDGVDYLLIVDSDMAPDFELGHDQDAQPFWESSIEFALNHRGPCVIAAPYCGPPPIENVYIFQWTDNQSDHPNRDGSLVQFSREQAAVMTGITEVAALPTGLMLLDVRALAMLPVEKPYTYYEWTDGWEQEKASTEDVTLTRDLSLAGVPVYCNWNAWAGHVKRKVVGRPRPYTSDMLAKRIHPAILARRDRDDRLRDITPNERFAADIAAAEREAAASYALNAEASPIPQFRATSLPPLVGTTAVLRPLSETGFHVGLDAIP